MTICGAGVPVLHPAVRGVKPVAGTWAWPGRPLIILAWRRPDLKSHLDALLLALPGVEARTVHGLDAYFVADKMFACISGGGVGLRFPGQVATELQFSRDSITAFQPRGLPATREWVQVNRADPADYAKDLDLFQESIAFVKKGRR
jgi:hypothetical protein